MELRPYQRAAVAAIEEAFAAHRSALLVLPTGCGKTVTFCEVIRRHRAKGRALVIAHREELLEQACGAIAGMGMTAELERAEKRASKTSLLYGHTDVVVGSIQTLRGRRLKSWDPGTFSLIVIDEAHHATAPGYRALLDHFAAAKVLGVTATPDRHDATALGDVFDHAAFTYQLRDAIDDGWLVDLDIRQVECADLDLTMCRSRFGDLSEADVAAAMELDSVCHQVAGPLVEQAAGRPTIAFTVSVRQAHALREVLSAYMPANRVGVIDGGMPAAVRRATVDAYRAGELQIVVNCMVLTEGFDAPRTEVIALARPTQSRALLAQMIGRGTRLHPGKTKCTVLDFVGATGRHRLATPADVLAGRELSDKERSKFAGYLSQRAASDSVTAVMRNAIDAAKAEEDAKKRAAEDAARVARQRHISFDVGYRLKSVDPFGIVRDRDAGVTRASEAQVAFLRQLGVELDDISTRQASKLIEKIKTRRKGGLCTYKQARLLASKGLNPDLPFLTAKRAIDELAANNWRVTDDMRRRYGIDV